MVSWREENFLPVTVSGLAWNKPIARIGAAGRPCADVFLRVVGWIIGKKGLAWIQDDPALPDRLDIWFVTDRGVEIGRAHV